MNRSSPRKPFFGVVVLALILASAASIAWFRHESRTLWDRIATQEKRAVTQAVVLSKEEKTANIAEPMLVVPKIPKFDHPEEFINVDLDSTSWEDPFQQKYWKSAGWLFDDKSMSCAAGDTSLATFRRSYNKLMLEFQVEPTETRSSFQILLTVPDSETVTAIDFGPDGIVVAEVSDELQTEIERRMLDLQLLPGQPARLRLAATGNRIVISWNGQRVLSCNQPVQKIGAGFRFTIASAKNGLQITKMRIEGE